MTDIPFFIKLLSSIGLIKVQVSEPHKILEKLKPKKQRKFPPVGVFILIFVIALALVLVQYSNPFQLNHTQKWNPKELALRYPDHDSLQKALDNNEVTWDSLPKEFQRSLTKP